MEDHHARNPRARLPAAAVLDNLVASRSPSHGPTRSQTLSRQPSVSSASYTSSGIMSLASGSHYVHGSSGSRQRLIMYRSHHSDDPVLQGNGSSSSSKREKSINVITASTIIILDILTKNAFPDRSEKKVIIDEAFATAIGITNTCMFSFFIVSFAI